MGSERARRYAEEYRRSMDAFARLIESLSEEQWRRTGANYPQRVNDEDENRPVGVIAHHVAETAPWIFERTLALAEGRPLPPPVSFQDSNARHAVEHAGATRQEVLDLLRAHEARIADTVGAFTDAQLEVFTETPAGRLSVADRIERVLIGHVRMHQGSIEAAIS